MYNIELTDNEAELFKIFRRNQETITALIQGSVFNAKACQVDLHFDHQGTLQRIQFHQDTYRRTARQLSPVVLLTLQQGTPTIE